MTVRFESTLMSPSVFVVSAYLAILQGVIVRIFAARHHCDINDMAQEAAREACGDGARIGTNDAVLMYFRAALERKALPRSQIDTLVREAGPRSRAVASRSSPKCQPGRRVTTRIWGQPGFHGAMQRM